MEILLHLSAGQGPDECKWVVARLAELFCREAQATGLEAAPVEPIIGLPASVLLRVAGQGGEGFVRPWQGSIRWIGASPFRPAHKRRNWFVALRRLPDAADIPDLYDRDISYQTLRASGPGGQHVNKTDSAVRAVHGPTGLTSFSQDQRSQFANKKIARMKLAFLLEERRARGEDEGRRALWAGNHDLERGNAVLTFEGPAFRRR